MDRNGIELCKIGLLNCSPNPDWISRELESYCVRFHGLQQLSMAIDEDSRPSIVSVQQATNIILSIAKRLSPVTLPLHDALGAILAEEIVAPEPLPPFPASIKVLGS